MRTALTCPRHDCDLPLAAVDGVRRPMVRCTCWYGGCVWNRARYPGDNVPDEMLLAWRARGVSWVQIGKWLEKSTQTARRYVLEAQERTLRAKVRALRAEVDQLKRERDA